MKFKLITLVLLVCSTLTWSQSTIVMENPSSGTDYSDVLNCHFNPHTCNVSVRDNQVQVTLTEGEWIINSTVELTFNDQLILEYGASIIRKDCSNTDPIFHLKGRNSAIYGKSKNLIKSECNSLQKGIIKIGHPTSTSPGNILSCQLHNLMIQGPTNITPLASNNFANDSFDEITGVYIYNNQNEPTQNLKTACYYHTLRDLDISFVSIGIHLMNVTASTFDNILFNRVGLHGGHGFLLQGGQENKISNVHHGFSPNANSLSFLQTRYSYKPAYNNVVNYIVEIGKTSGNLARINGGGYCLNLDADPRDFYSNNISVNCNHSRVAKLKVGTTLDTYQTQQNRSEFR